MKLLTVMLAIALVGTVMTGCSSDDDSTDNKKVVTLTTTIGFEDNSAKTRLLDGNGEKTFAAGEQIALRYYNGSSWVKAESDALQSTNISNGGKLAQFSFNLNNPNARDVTYIYPASMANSDGSVNYGALTSQNGTLEYISDNLDLATLTGNYDGVNLPEGTLQNQLAILAIKLKNSDGTNDITSSIKSLQIEAAGSTYTVEPTSSLGIIYVAIQPVSGAINVTASDETNTYSKELTGKTYAAGHGYNVSWRMNVTN